MTATVDDLGQDETAAAAGLIVLAHHGCRDCRADREQPLPVARCEPGGWAAARLAEHQARRRDAAGR
ncbi:hypothetical protein [Micromonospora sp. DT229]|uniref:hypothetical protein n=1 Tax=Micromonospora sp. DT229 TaxID=3393430 RepID=UPI003CFB9FDD